MTQLGMGKSCTGDDTHFLLVYQHSELCKRRGLGKGLPAGKGHSVNIATAEDLLCDPGVLQQGPWFKRPEILVEASRAADRASLCPEDTPDPRPVH